MTKLNRKYSVFVQGVPNKRKGEEMKKKELTLEMITNAIVRELDPYQQAAKFHIEAILSKEGVAEGVKEVHMSALFDIFVECPLLLDFFLADTVKNNIPIPSFMTDRDFRANLALLSAIQMNEIVQNLAKGTNK